MSDVPKQMQHTTALVQTASTLAVPENKLRTYMILQNDSAQNIYFSMGVTAALGTGVRLIPAGGSFEMSARNQNVDIRAVFAIHGGPSGTVNLLVTEC